MFFSKTKLVCEVFMKNGAFLNGRQNACAADKLPKAAMLLQIVPTYLLQTEMTYFIIMAAGKGKCRCEKEKN